MRTCTEATALRGGGCNPIAAAAQELGSRNMCQCQMAVSTPLYVDTKLQHKAEEVQS